MAVSNTFQKMKVSEAKRANVDTNLKIKDEELVTFTESCRDLYEAGVPVNELLRQLQQATTNKRFALGLSLMLDDIENGKLLSEAMGRYPNVFGDDYRSLIRAAEQSGKWTRRRDKFGEMREGILDMLINYLKRRKSARDRVKAGLMYPGFIAGVLLIAITLFAFFILPTLKDLFGSLDSKMLEAPMTKILFGTGDFIRNYWWIIIVATVGLTTFLVTYWKSGAGKKIWMHYQLRARGIGPLFVNMNVGEIMWLMGTLFSAGMTPQESLDILSSSARNYELSKALELAKEYLYQGIPFSDALKKAHWVFDGQTYMVLSSAQKSGRLGTTLQNYAAQLFEKVDQGVERFVKMIEPFVLCIVGILIGLMLVGIYGGISGGIGGLAR
jgi:type II secretory pathway component PulF